MDWTGPGNHGYILPAAGQIHALPHRPFTHFPGKATKPHVIKDRQLYLYILLFFMAAEVILAFSAFGYIVVEPISITFMTIPVLFGAYVLGPLAGAILGCVFGLTSIWKASISAVACADQVFSPFLSGSPAESLVLSLGTRVAFGCLAGCLFRSIREYRPSKACIVAGVLVANLFHSTAVFLCLDLFFPQTHITLAHGLERLASPTGLANYAANILAVLLLDRFLHTDFMSRLSSELRYSNRNIRNRTFYIINLSFIALLLLFFFGLMYHFYGRVGNLLHYYGVVLEDEVRVKLINLGMQLLVVTVSVCIIIEVVFIVFGNYFMRLVFQARRDMMTLLLNKNTFVRHVNASLEDSASSSFLLILDVDNFKRLNDTYGHPNGDRVLISIAHILRTTFEDCGIVGRLGGDEFAVFCEDVTLRDIEDRAAKVCARVTSLVIHGVHGISCSIGVARCVPGEGFSTAYPRADRALYRAKELGKNRYFVGTD